MDSRDLVRNLTSWLGRAALRVRNSPVAGTALLAAVVGAVTGLGAVAFIEIIKLFQRLFFDEGAKAFAGLGGWYVLLLPVIGGLVVGPLVHFLAPEAKGHGVPEVMAAIEIRGGRIRPVVILVKAVASAITIGSGGAVGREGPIIQIGAAVGSTLGQFLKIDRQRLLTLVGAGAAEGAIELVLELGLALHPVLELARVRRVREQREQDEGELAAHAVVPSKNAASSRGNRSRWIG